MLVNLFIPDTSYCCSVYFAEIAVIDKLYETTKVLKKHHKTTDLFILDVLNGLMVSKC